MSGGQTPGAPAISVGRTNDIAWAFTTTRVDTSDLWQEKLNEEGTQYFVNEKWHDLEVITESIPIKGEENEIHQIKSTHRGPIIPFNLL